jgi:hypothetical protein
VSASSSQLMFTKFSYHDCRLTCNAVTDSSHLQFLQRALSHGESSLTIDGSILPNAVFFSQQLEAWGILQDEFQTKFIAAAAAMAKLHPLLKWNQQSIDGLWSSLKKE